jgi:hypothetical protein
MHCVLKPNDWAQGQAGFTPMNFDLPGTLAGRMTFDKPRCQLVPCSPLLYAIVIIVIYLNRDIPVER